MTTPYYWNAGADAGGDGSTNALSSGDGTHACNSLSAAFSQVYTDFSGTLTDDVIIYGEGSTTDTVSPANDGGVVTTATYDLSVIVTSTHNHGGVQGGGLQMVATDNFNGIIEQTTEYSVFSGLDVINHGTSGAAGFDYNNPVSCLTVNTFSEGGARGSFFEPRDGSIFECCIALNSTGIGYNTAANAEPIFRHCGAYNNTSGFYNGVSGTGAPTAINCWSVGNTTNWNDSGRGWDAASDYNAGESGDTIPGTNDQTIVATAGVDITNAATGDFTVVTTGNLYHTGTTTGGPATDIIENSFHASTPNIGPFATVAGGGGGGYTNALSLMGVG